MSILVINVVIFIRETSILSSDVNELVGRTD